MQQTTIARAVSWRGIGLHGGRPAAVTVRPAGPDTGLVFVLVGEAGGGETAIPVAVASVHASSRATTLAATLAAATHSDPDAVRSRASRAGAATRDDASIVRVATVEHLLAALFALEIHNARIEVEGGEVPALDGSAGPFAKRLRRAGRRTLAAVRRELEPARPFEVRAGDRSIRIEPHEGLAIDYTIDFTHPHIGRQRFVLDRSTPERFESELAAARTFGFADEVERLHAQGLALGGDLSNTLVFGAEGLVNPGGLYFADELVRHKVVDLLGDLALLGASLHARIVVERGGHGLHHALVRTLVEQPGALVERQIDAPARTRRGATQPA